jgi:hypothetical protein
MNRVSEALTDLAACLCASLLAAELPAVCFCGVTPGASIALDYAGDCSQACGMAWVRLESMYPSVVLGQPDATPGNCGTTLEIAVEMGVARCLPVIDESGTPPSAQELADSTELQIADALAMRTAVACCVRGKDWVLGGYTPFGPQGGMVGGTWSLVLQVF